MADVQMLGMLSCAFAGRWSTSKAESILANGCSSTDSLTSESDVFQLWSPMPKYYASEELAKTHLHEISRMITNSSEYPETISEPNSANSSTGAPLSDLSASTTPPSRHKPLRTGLGRRESLATSLSTSPELLRQTYRSTPHLTQFGASLPRPLMRNASAASSPPNNFPKKGPSPAGSYGGISTSTNVWGPSQIFGRSSSTLTEDPKASFTLSISDSGEDVPPRIKPSFITKLKDQDKFQNDAYSDVALLDSRQEWQYRAYREAYAHLTYIWDLPIVRTEILKHNGTQTPDGTVSDVNSGVVSMGRNGVSKSDTNLKAQRPDLSDLCWKCEAVLPDKPLGHRCQNCFARRTSLMCLLCNTFIHGLSSPCLNCGHVLHNSCRELLLTQPPDAFSAECISGCGCVCADHMSVQVETAEAAVQVVHADSSPALTVIGENDHDEKEQVGWYENSEWEDMAYESLARNLRPRQEVKPKGSQIWRRRQESA